METTLIFLGTALVFTLTLECLWWARRVLPIPYGDAIVFLGCPNLAALCLASISYRNTVEEPLLVMVSMIPAIVGLVYFQACINRNMDK